MLRRSDYFIFEKICKPLDIKYAISILIISFLFTACSLFKGGKIPQELNFEFNENDYINYGYHFNFDTYIAYSNGKTKKVSDKDELNIEIEGGSYSNGKISIASYPNSFQKDTLKIKATYTKDETVLSKSIIIPYNYNGDLQLNFVGAMGDKGESGRNVGTSLLFGWGKDADNGTIGYDGKNGSDLTVHIWQDTQSQLYFIKVTDLVQNKNYFFKTMDKGYGIKINVNGGTGGKGGDGGDGGDGRDGKVKNDKKKNPGNGGNGGNGGQGGNGGNGGSVYVFIHPNAASLQSKIAVYNYGGSGGGGGDPGKGGKGGSPLEGQTAGTSGSDGVIGFEGNQGLTGEAIQIIVEEFDIEY